MEQSLEKAQRTYIKLIVGSLLGFVLFIFVCWGGWRLYGGFESRHSARRAAAYLSSGELRQAALSARRALELDGNNIAGINVMAKIAEVTGDRSAIGWRRRALELEPHSTANQLALALCALQFNDVGTAEKILGGVDQNSRDTAAFHAAAARLAEKKGQPKEAEQHWVRAVELAPNEKSYQLDFGSVLLRSEDQMKRERGRKILDSLRNDEQQRAAATRALIRDGAARHISSDILLARAKELQGYPEATFSDRLLYLDILRQLRAPSFTEYLSVLEKAAISEPTNLALLITWMKTSGMSLLAVDFIRTLPKETVNKWPVPMAVAEIHAKLQDWPDLEARMKREDWGQFDFMRHAYLALALRNQGRTVAADGEWSAAEKNASTQPGFLSTLARATAEWHWEKEWLGLLWALTKYPETQLEAFQSLHQKYVDDGDTPGLHRVLLRVVEMRPQDKIAQNNLAQVSLLLNTDVERACRVAAELYESDTTNPAYASTYAFSLFRKGDAAAAVKVMNGLTEEELKEPSLAAYYGILLAAAGDSTKAREYLKYGASAKLLPEERALLTAAESKIQ